jgi:3-deoxy-manno-octulosonate cytidylyltransferase (CMP-KDO synthetase)
MNSPMIGSFKVVIPARYASTRLPAKPLADIHGKPMILRVVERALASGADEVVVATDDDRVAEAVRSAGHQAALTRSDHASGSDRVMEVVQQRQWADQTLVINVQGDEPLIPPGVIRHLGEAMAARPEIPVGTVCERLDDAALLFDPNVVKVVRGERDQALYFSRAPIPYARDAFARAGVSNDGVMRAPPALPDEGGWYRHVGIYAFRVEALRRFVAWPMGRLERLESLEQLRLLEHGVELLVVEALEAVPGGVDTPADLERVRHLVGGVRGAADAASRG